MAGFGFSSLAAYAVVGCLVMNRWAVAAASEVPLSTAVADIAAAGQTYSTLPGFIFASAGLLFALAWVTFVLRQPVRLPAAVAIWAGLIAAAAPAYFFLSFGNLNSVGDTYPDWNSEAAFAVEAPLYLVSALALLIAASAGFLSFRQHSRQSARST